MEYTNYLTTPSGRYCQVKDITNGEYMIMVKFLQSQNYKKFFEYLNYVAKNSIPQIDTLDIVEKCYVYIAMCMYSIRGTIAVNNKLIGQQEIPLGIILNNIESSYVPNFIVQYQLKKDVILKFGYPKKFSYQGNTPVIDYFSGLIGYNDVILTEEQIDTLKRSLGTKQLSFIDDFLREKMYCKCDIFQGCQPYNTFQMDIVSESLIMNLSSFFRITLDGMYTIMYTMIKHLKMTYSDFMKISPVETSIMMKICAEENKKMQEESKGGKLSPQMMRQLEDE